MQSSNSMYNLCQIESTVDGRWGKEMKVSNSARWSMLRF